MEQEVDNRQFNKMTQTPIERLIVLLSLPTIASMMITNIYNLVDTGFVSKLGNSESGAVGIIFGYMAILQAIGFLFGQGAGSLMSRKLGEKDVAEASNIATTGFIGSFFSALFTGVFGIITIDKLVMWLGSTDTIAPFAKDYLLYICIAAPFTSATFTLNNLLRYEGKAFLGMIGLMIGAVLNMACDPIFIFVLGMKVRGAGLSTAISQIISFTILLLMFFTGKTQSKLFASDYSFRFKRFANIILTGFPSMIRQVLNSVTTIILNKVVGVYGDSAVAAMSIVSRISFFAFSVALGVGQGFQPVSAFNFGAKKYARVKRAFWCTVILAAGLLLIFAGGAYIFAEPLVRSFRDDPHVIEVGTRALKLQCLAQVVMPLCMTTEMLFQSTGQKLGASLLSASRSGFFFIPALLLLAHFRGLRGIEEAQPVAFILSFIPAIICIAVYMQILNKKIEEEKLEETN